MQEFIFTYENVQFQRGFNDAILPSLLEFICMIEHGVYIKSQLKFGASKTDSAMAQLLQYNCFSRYKEGASTYRHSKERETPFPLFLARYVCLCENTKKSFS